MAVNGGAATPRSGNSSDWIELFNAAGKEIDLNGWHLTDRSGELTLWTFPPVTLPADGFLVVFASGKDSRYLRCAVSAHPLHRLGGCVDTLLG
jgi:hypothetical protein